MLEPPKDDLFTNESLPDFNGRYTDAATTAPNSAPCSLRDLSIAFNNSHSSEQQQWMAKAQHDILHASDNTQAINLFLRCSAISVRHFNKQSLLKDKHKVLESVRLLLLEALRQKVGENWPDALFKVFRQSDDEEKISILRGLHFFDSKGNLLKIALDAGRTNSVAVFSALALENSYPASVYGEDAFNKLVLKALFLDLDIGLIVDLDTRSNPTLSQLCMDLVHERILAKRNPPYSIWLGMRFDELSESDQRLYLEYLLNQDAISPQGDEITCHCEYCLRSLLQHPPTAHPAIDDCLAQLLKGTLSASISAHVAELVTQRQHIIPNTKSQS